MLMLIKLILNFIFEMWIWIFRLENGWRNMVVDIHDQNLTQVLVIYLHRANTHTQLKQVFSQVKGEWGCCFLWANAMLYTKHHFKL